MFYKTQVQIHEIWTYDLAKQKHNLKYKLHKNNYMSGCKQKSAVKCVSEGINFHNFPSEVCRLLKLYIRSTSSYWLMSLVNIISNRKWLKKTQSKISPKLLSKQSLNKYL